jgi:hypothetical protein
MKKLLILATALGLLLASDAFGATLGFSNCRSKAISPPNMNKAGLIACYEFDDATDSGQFTVVTPTALICLDPDIAATGTSTAEVMIYQCPTGAKPAANPTYGCHAILDASLDGTEGGSTNQNACVRVGPGAYYIDVTSADTNSKDAIVTITGE